MFRLWLTLRSPGGTVLSSPPVSLHSFTWDTTSVAATNTAPVVLPGVSLLESIVAARVVMTTDDGIALAQTGPIPLALLGYNALNHTVTLQPGHCVLREV